MPRNVTSPEQFETSVRIQQAHFRHEPVDHTWVILPDAWARWETTRHVFPLDESMFLSVGETWFPVDLTTMRRHVRDADIAEARLVAEEFSRRVESHPATVLEVWLAFEGDEALITAVLPESDLETELGLEALFATVLQRTDRFRGYLRIYNEESGVPTFARDGEQVYG